MAHPLFYPVKFRINDSCLQIVGVPPTSASCKVDKYIKLIYSIVINLLGANSLIFTV